MSKFNIGDKVHWDGALSGLRKTGTIIEVIAPYDDRDETLRVTRDDDGSVIRWRSSAFTPSNDKDAQLAALKARVEGMSAVVQAARNLNREHTADNQLELTDALAVLDAGVGGEANHG